jgi:hypothetical protein
LRPKTKEKEVLFLAAAGEFDLFAVRAPFLACGRAVAFWPAAERKVPYFCFGFGSFAAKTKAIKRFSALPEANPACLRKKLFISFVLAAKPPKRTKKTVLSMLPQAKKPLRLEQNTPTA